MGESLQLLTTGYVAIGTTELVVNPYLCETGTKVFGNFQPFVSLCGDASYSSDGKLKLAPDLFVTGAVGHLAVQVGGGIGASYDTTQENVRPKGSLVFSTVLPFPRTVQTGVLVTNTGTSDFNPSVMLFVGGSLSDVIRDI